MIRDARVKNRKDQQLIGDEFWLAGRNSNRKAVRRLDAGEKRGKESLVRDQTERNENGTGDQARARNTTENEKVIIMVCVCSLSLSPLDVLFLLV